MAQSGLQLPPEVWNYVFSFLSVSDKFSARTTCKYFKKLIDHWSLWKDWSVVLSFRNGTYNDCFWATLRRRKVTSVVMRSSVAAHWTQLSQALPGVSTVVLEEETLENALCSLQRLPHVKRLAVRSNFLWCNTNLGAFALQLTHLSLCGVRVSAKDAMAALTQFTNLTSLDCHLEPNGIQTFHFQAVFDSLPKLKSLSLCCKKSLFGYQRFEAGCRAAALSSLELINCICNTFPLNIMRPLPRLRSLSVYHGTPPTRMRDVLPSDDYLRLWLCDLPQLSSLVIFKGPAVNVYASSIPTTVTRLTLRVPGLSAGDMAAVAAQVPDLLHLHIDPWPSHLGAHTSKIPKLFPKLRSLKVRLQHVPEEDFLQLRKLEDLQHLEVLDSCPDVCHLIGKLRQITKNRFHISTSPLPRDVLCCDCTQ